MTRTHELERWCGYDAPIAAAVGKWINDRTTVHFMTLDEFNRRACDGSLIKFDRSDISDFRERLKRMATQAPAGGVPRTGGLPTQS